ncbi:hypothetical protein N7456_002445 [Penicillium angulare]|uniref:Uncharacterized protein n=1 Tax=Penicillium angulare TaxID=116970 RepID=A0A9W9KQ96_9EURO|nr:hypothetical protein N7456_002445 [Penicillium angulare]
MKLSTILTTIFFTISAVAVPLETAQNAGQGELEADAGRLLPTTAIIMDMRLDEIKLARKLCEKHGSPMSNVLDEPPVTLQRLVESSKSFIGYLFALV